MFCPCDSGSANGSGRDVPPMLQYPSGAVITMDEEIVDGPVRGTHSGAVPLDLSADAERDVAQQNQLGERAGVVEAGPGGLSGLAGLDPLGMVAGRTRKRRLGRDKAGEVLLGEQPGASSSVSPDQQPALLAHEDAAAGVLGGRVAVEQLGGRKLAAVVPEELDRRPRAPRAGNSYRTIDQAGAVSG